MAASKTETVEKALDEAEAKYRKPVVVTIVPTPHGGLFALTDDGVIWERYADPAPRQTPGPTGHLWRKIEGP